MNWILTLIFLCVVFLVYYLIGSAFISFFHLPQVVESKIISGFLITFLLLFITGFPAQNFHLSWNLYFFSSLILLLVTLFLLAIKFRISFDYRNITLPNFFIFIQKNWISITLVIILTVLSISNQLPYLQQNYDDTFYIGKIANIIGSPKIGIEDYYYGGLLRDLSLNFNRFLNTYEMSYAFLSKCFFIEVPFFCRVSMVIHNYILMVFVYRMFASLFISRKYLNYSLLPFFILIFAQGFLMYGLPLIHIRSYDLWQSQTAIFYGGSVVRVFSLPILIYYYSSIFYKLDFKKLVGLGLITFSFLTFSTIFIGVFAVFLCLFLFTKILQVLINFIMEKCSRETIISTILLATYLLLVFVIFVFWRRITFPSYSEAATLFESFRLEYYKADLLLRIFPVILVILLLLNFKKYTSWILIGLLFGWVVIVIPQLRFLLIMSSLNIGFVALRVVSSYQMLILSLIGVAFVMLVKHFMKTKVRKILLSTVSLACILVLVLIFKVQYNKIVTYNQLGFGVIKEGYDFSRVFNLDEHMTPDLYKKLGDYLQSLPYSEYRIYMPLNLEYNGITTNSMALYMSTNRAEMVAMDPVDGLKEHEKVELNNIILGKKDITQDDFLLIEKKKIRYILFLNKRNMNRMSEFGYKQVWQYPKNDSIYLMKTN